MTATHALWPSSFQATPTHERHLDLRTPGFGAGDRPRPDPRYDSRLRAILERRLRIMFPNAGPPPPVGLRVRIPSAVSSNVAAIPIVPLPAADPAVASPGDTGGAAANFGGISTMPIDQDRKPD